MTISGKVIKASGVLDNAFLEGWSVEKVLAMKPRPEPSTYLKPSFISEHLAKFNNGASCLTFESSINTYNQIGRNDGLFILPKLDMDRILQTARGDIQLIEKALGIPEGSWQNRLNNPLSPDKLVRVDISNPNTFNLRIPSGNEAGANQYWIPCGFTPEEFPEAVINSIPSVQTSSYTKTIISQTK